MKRYDRPGPRSTSYPAVPEWSDGFDEAAFRDALARARGPISLYVHVPFCERLCSFCACNRVITRDHSVAAPYLDGLEREAELLAAALPGGVRAAQLAIGGGSPNFLSPRELSRLCAILDRTFPPERDAERSIELDPRNTTREQLETLAEHGFNRMSLGVQDLPARVQKAINRIQSREQVEVLTTGARELGVGSVSFDLIYGLPYQTESSFAETLDLVLGLRPDRIALYSYAHVTWISKAQRGFERKDLPPPERKLAIERLTRSGYRFLGMDHFALPEDDLSLAADRGELRRNFMGYTTRAGVDLIALGPSGISELRDAYAQSEKDAQAWQRMLGDGQLATVRGCRLSSDDRQRKWLIQRLMCRGEISADAFRAEFGLGLGRVIPELQSRLEEFERERLLEARPDGWALSALGRIFLRVIAMSFDAYLGAADAAEPRFSRTV